MKELRIIFCVLLTAIITLGAVLIGNSYGTKDFCTVLICMTIVLCVTIACFIIVEWIFDVNIPKEKLNKIDELMSKIDKINFDFEDCYDSSEISKNNIPSAITKNDSPMVNDESNKQLNKQLNKQPYKHIRKNYGLVEIIKALSRAISEI